MGRSDIFLKLEVIKKAVATAALLATMWISAEAMAVSLLFTSVATQIINSWPNKELLDYSYVQQLKDILPHIAVSMLMAFCVYFIQYLGFPNLITIIVQIIVGGLFYLLASVIFKFETFTYIVEVIKQYTQKQKK